MVFWFVILVQQRRRDGLSHKFEILADCGDLDESVIRTFYIVETCDIHVFRDTKAKLQAAYIHMKGYYIVPAKNCRDALLAQVINKMLQ